VPRDGVVFENEAGAFQRRADMGDLKKGNITYANARPSAQLLLQDRPPSPPRLLPTKLVTQLYAYRFAA
jgi:hypothetical protein